MLHPFGCSDNLVLELDNSGVGMLLLIGMLVRNELACFDINVNGSDGCHVTFVAREYARMVTHLLMCLSVWSLFTCQTMKTGLHAGFLSHSQFMSK